MSETQYPDVKNTDIECPDIESCAWLSSVGISKHSAGMIQYMDVKISGYRDINMLKLCKVGKPVIQATPASKRKRDPVAVAPKSKVLKQTTFKVTPATPAKTKV